MIPVTVVGRLSFGTSTFVSADVGAAFLPRLKADLEDLAEVRCEGAMLIARTGTVYLDIRQEPAALTIEARTADASTLAWLKTQLAEKVAEACGAGFEVIWTDSGPVAPARRAYRRMHVVSVRDLTPRMRRLTLHGSDLVPFATGGLHVGLHLPAGGGSDLPEPQVEAGGRLIWPADRPEPSLRAYTLRSVDVAREIVEIDFVLHSGGGQGPAPGARFAQTARPGSVVGMSGPGGGGLPVADRLILAGDETALPMIARMLERLGPHQAASVLIEVDSLCERQPLQSAAAVDIQWIDRSKRQPDVLLNALVALAPTVAARALSDLTESSGRQEIAPDSMTWSILSSTKRFHLVGECSKDGFILYCGEMGLARRIKERLRTGLKLDPSTYLSVGFWRC